MTKTRSIFPKKIIRSSRAGFTILETLIALAILTSAVVGPFTLITQALWSATNAKNDLVANGIAQEGIELVRAIRDDMALCDHIDGADNNSPDWRSNPSQPGNTLGGDYEVDVLRTAAISCGAKSIAGVPSVSFGCSSARTLLKNDQSVYTYTAGTPTLFSRCITITAPPAVPDMDIPDQDQMDVKAEVRWQERATQKSIVVTERLYNWR